ncbi:hypothetical protein [uncultured Sulfitobacter sp.]|uniref:hypothetical protein n=1 Tax=uncultured Sulfitobacter sp. TaxID=191468 RepID=UPI0026131A4E|nr:hypothetical protein [uncultured Sulfitobacter sp.]
MKRAAAFGIVALFALTACDEGAGSSAALGRAAAAPKQEGQLCALSVAQCQSFSAQSAALLPVLDKPAGERSAKDDKTVQLVLDTFLSSQSVADQSCSPATGTLKRKARMVSKNGQTAILMGRGSDVCTLIRAN